MGSGIGLGGGLGLGLGGGLGLNGGLGLGLGVGPGLGLGLVRKHMCAKRSLTNWHRVESVLYVTSPLYVVGLMYS